MMRTLNIGILLLLFASLGACTNNQQSKKLKPCSSREACLNDPNCLCWCSQVCNWRKKTPQDHPIYIENDRNGKFCYCKQWDYDHYEDNCINGKHVKQTPGAR